MYSQPRSLNISFPKNAQLLYQEALKNTDILSTGCPGFDNMLNGGLWTGECLEVFGIPGTGKTQFCKTMCASVLQSPEKSVLYMDANGSFVCERLLEIVANRNDLCTPQFLEDAFSRIKLLRVFDAQSLLVELRRFEGELTLQVEKFLCQVKLLILDSITPLISPILGGGQTQGHMLMMEIGRVIKQIGVKHNIACVIVNGAVMDTDPERTSTYKPALGKSWKSVPHTRLYFETTDNVESTSKSSHAILTKSSRQAVGGSARFCITAKGIECLESQ